MSFFSSRAGRSGPRSWDPTVFLVGATVSWVFQNAVMIVAVLPVVPPVLEGSTLPPTSIQWALTLYGVAIVYAAAGAGLFAVGIIAGVTVVSGLPKSASSPESSRGLVGTRRIGTTAGVLFLVYAALAIAAAAVLVPISAAPPAQIPSGSVGFILAAWVLGSAILFLSSGVHSWYLYRRQVETSDFERFRDPGMVIYAVWNFGGSVLLAVPLWGYVESLTIQGSRSLTNIISQYLPLGAAVELLVGPVLGIVVFALLMRHLFRLDRPRRIPELSKAIAGTESSPPNMGP